MTALLLAVILLTPGPATPIVTELPEAPQGSRHGISVTVPAGRFTVTSVAVVGNERLSSEEITHTLGISSGSSVDAHAIRSALRRLWSRGFFFYISATLTKTSKGYVLYVTVKEKPRVAAIVIHGNVNVSLEDINKTVTIEPKKPLNEAKVQETADAIRNMYRTKGYPFASVRVNFEYTDTGDIEVHFYISEKHTVRIASVTFSGNKFLPASKLLQILNLKPSDEVEGGEYFVDSLAEEDQKRIMYFYAMHGFFLTMEQERMSPVRAVVRFSSDLTEAYIHYTINEGTHWKLDSYDFRGKLLAPMKALAGADASNARQAALQKHRKIVARYLKPGTYLSVQDLERARQAIKSFYESHGYFNPAVGTRLQKVGEDRLREIFTVDVNNNGQAHPVLDLLARGLDANGVALRKFPNTAKNINEIKQLQGKSTKDASAVRAWSPMDGKAFIERIEIVGNSRTRDKVIRREMVINEGDAFSMKKIRLSEARIKRLGFFEKVSIEPEQGTSSNAVRLKVKVKERNTGTFQIGAGFSTYENFVFQAQITHQNLFGNGQTLMLQAQLSSLRQLFNLKFIEPHFLDTNWYFSFSLYNSMYSYGSFTKKSTGGSLSWGYNITPFHRLYITYKLADVQIGTGTTLLGGTLGTSPSFFSMPSSAYVSNLFNDGITSSFTLTGVWDRRNDRMFPSKGFMHGGSVEVARPEFFSENVYNRYEAYSRWYYPVWNRIGLVFKFNSEIGYITSPNSEGVPIFLRYFLGGINSVRGFALYSLAPRMKVPVSPDPNAPLFDFRKGGNKKLVFNWELEFDLLKPMMLKGVMFVDAGNSYDDDEPYSLERMRWAWGFGVRWFSPMGILRFEWGLPFNPRPGEDKIVFQFSMGNFF